MNDKDVRGVKYRASPPRVISPAFYIPSSSRTLPDRSRQDLESAKSILSPYYVRSFLYADTQSREQRTA